MDVYTGLLAVAVLVLAAGVALVAMANIKHSEGNNQPGGMLKLIQSR